MPGNDIQGGFATHVVVPCTGNCAKSISRASLAPGDARRRVDRRRRGHHALSGRASRGRAPGSLVVVVGAGGVGGYCVQIAHAVGGRVVAIDVDDAKARHDRPPRRGIDAEREEARRQGAQGSDRRFRAPQPGCPRPNGSFFECSGTAAGQATAFGLLVHGATLSVVGFTMDKVEVRLSNLMAFDARALGNWGCPPEYYAAALDLVLDGRIAVKPFVEARRLDDINDVFAAVHHREIHKRAVLVPA
jgi:6-hydroxycyclohex-1-ene-1-carbonyl-CoA dehydrogenase